MQFVLSMVLAGSVGGVDRITPEFDPWRHTARYEVLYRADVSELVSAGGGTRLWLPMPLDNAYQSVMEETVDAPWAHKLTRDQYGNRFVYLEPKPGADSPSTVEMRFVIQRRPTSQVRRLPVRLSIPQTKKLFLGARRRIPLGGVIRELADRIGAGRSTDLEKERGFYDYVVANVRYSKHGKGWGHGDAVWACNAKYGNCTDFHSLLIGMARTYGIPARFIIGFPIPSDQPEGQAAGYHCWAEMLDSAGHWTPVDASEANKSGRADDYFGALPSDRIAFTVGRDLALQPPQDGPPLNFFVYPYAERSGKPASGVSWSLSFRRLGYE